MGGYHLKWFTSSGSSRNDHYEDDVPLPNMSVTNPVDLIGCILLFYQQEDRPKFWARLTEAINAHEDTVKINPEL